MLFPRPRSAPRRVVITGAGLVTALGVGWQANAAGFREGRTAFRRVTQFEVSRQRVAVAAEVELPERLPPTRLSEGRRRHLDRASRLLLFAAEEAWRQSGWTAAERAGFVLGTTGGGMPEGEAYYRQALSGSGRRRGQARRAVSYLLQTQGRWVAEALGLEGGPMVLSHACASGADAIGLAWDWVRYGLADRVLAGSHDVLSQVVFGGFDALQLLSPTSCRPFDATRDGLALGEGAAVVAVEAADSARRRGAEILGEILGYGAVLDPHHLAQPHPDGEAALAAMRAAAAVAGVVPEDVGYINAHGTGTVLNDRAESQAIARWAGGAAGGIALSSTKASVGHTLGAAGGVEAVVCLMVLREQWLPPELGVVVPEPLCPCPLVRAPRSARVRVALSNSLGFGGANATLIFRRWA